MVYFAPRGASVIRRKTARDYLSNVDYFVSLIRNLASRVTARPEFLVPGLDISWSIVF